MELYIIKNIKYLTFGKGSNLMYLIIKINCFFGV